MKISNTGYKVGVWATAIVLIWIGIFKFTPTEAMGIKGYVGNSFLISWIYKILSVGAASMLIGTVEIATGLLLVASLWNAKAGKIAGILTGVIFITTLSFLLTTPGTWKAVDGVPVTDFFVLKDLAYLGVGLMVFERSGSTAGV